ncbi:SDR family oxidoreductase [Nocardioides sp. AN3]
MVGELTGSTAIVTGGSRGIGLATAAALVAAGANVVLTSRRREAAEAAADEINLSSEPGGGIAVGYGAHAADETAAAACVEHTVSRFGSLDILVNNAGTNPAYGPLVDQDHARFTKTFEVNVWAPLLWSALAVRAWMGEHGGSIVNLASIGGMSVEPSLGVYNATKAAMIHVTRQQAFELAPRVRVNAVAPGVVRTRLAEALWSDHEDSLNRSLPLGRIGEPADIGEAIVFLASDRSSWITGATLLIDGGMLLGDAASAAAEAVRRTEKVHG